MKPKTNLQRQNNVCRNVNKLRVGLKTALIGTIGVRYINNRDSKEIKQGWAIT